jgi:hypothetical protein
MEMDSRTPPDDVARLRAAIERAEPPAALRLQVGRQIAQARKQRARRRRAFVGVLAAAGALGASALVLVSPRGSSPTVEQVVRVAATAPRAPAPPVDGTDRRRLAAHVDDVWFPSWRGLHWRPVGRSSHAIGGRSAETVYYARDDGVRVAYTIVAGGALPWPNHTRVVTYGWTRLRVYSDAGRRVIGWRRGDHLCLIAGPRSLPKAALLALSEGDA